MIEPFESLRALFSNAGYTFIEPPIVYDARVFVELAGEDLRRRLFLTSGPDGSEFALRPDYTIPVCLAHLAGGPARRRADYAYLGPVFRQRTGESGEFLQAGIESLGRGERAAADADVFALALATVDVLGITQPVIRIGDSALFAALLDALDVPGPWRRRLGRTFGDPERLPQLIAKAANGVRKTSGMDRRTARCRAQELLSVSGLGTIGSRTADEIANRVVETAALAAGIGERTKAVLERYLAIEGPPGKAIGSISELAKREGLDIAAAADRFEKRIAAFAKCGVDTGKLAFSADFGRRLDYYTGFVFEIHDPRRRDGRQILGGGRYDRLLSLIPRSGGGVHGQSIPAVGFSVWLDRIGAPP